MQQTSATTVPRALLDSFGSKAISANVEGGDILKQLSKADRPRHYGVKGDYEGNLWHCHF